MNRKTAYLLTAFAIGIPILVMFWNAKAGAALLLLGTYIAYRSIRVAGYNESQRVSDEELQRIDRQDSNRGRTILVQLVDEHGRDLPEHIARQRIAEAEAKASPRDTVIGVHYVLSQQETPGR
jgi:hypothetical protein